MNWIATQITKRNIDAFEPLIDERSRAKFVSESDTFGIGAVSDNRACGALIYTYDGDVIRVISLAVTDECRRQKAGTFLMDTLCRLAYDKVIPIFIDFYTEGNPDLDERWHFFSNLNGFSAELADARVYSIPISEVGKVIEGKLPKNSGKVKPLYFAKQDRKTKKQLLNYLDVTEEIIGSGKQVVAELCMYLCNDEKPTAAVFVRRGENPDAGEIEISYLWGNNPQAIVKLLPFFLDKLSHSSSDYKTLIMATVNDRSDRLAQYFLGEKYIINQGVSVVWDMDAFPLSYGEE